MQQYLEKSLAGPLSASYIAPGADHDLLAMLADVAARQRDAAALSRYAARAEALSAEHGHQLYLGVARRALGVAHRLAGEYEASGARLAQSLALFEPLDTRWQMGMVWYEMGELAAAQQQTAVARDHFRHALALFEEMGARPAATQTVEKLATLP